MLHISPSVFRFGESGAARRLTCLKVTSVVPPATKIERSTGRQFLRWVPFLVQIALTAAISAYLLVRIDLEAALASLKKLQLLDLVVIVILLAGQILVTAVRLAMTVRFIASRCSFGTALEAILVSVFFAQTPLSTIGGDAMKGWVLYSRGVPARDAASSVALERAFGALSLLLIVVLVLPPLWRLIESPSLRFGILAVIAAGTVFAAAFASLMLIPDMFRRFRFVAWLHQTAVQFVRILLRPSMALSLLGLGAASHAFSLLLVILLSSVIEVPASPWDILVLAPFPLLASLLPISIGGWGVREGAMVVALSLAGASAEQGLAVSVAYGLAMMAGGLPGAIVWLLADRFRQVTGDETISRDD